jgi:DinB family protein
MGQWEHLFMDGEFMSRARLLSGLTVEQVSVRPPGLPHTIYEELWHTTKWQSIVVRCDEPAAAAYIDGGPQFPSEAPGNERMWENLVTEFLSGSKTAVELGHSREALMKEVRPGVMLAEELESLAVHNAYHLGKIVALRQVIDAWPPPG